MSVDCIAENLETWRFMLVPKSKESQLNTTLILISVSHPMEKWQITQAEC